MATEFYTMRGERHCFWTEEDAAILARLMSGTARNAVECGYNIRRWARNYGDGQRRDVANGRRLAETGKAHRYAVEVAP
jgi:hypothetical protein